MGFGEFAPFGLAIFAAVCSNKIPAGIVYIISAIGTFIRFGVNGLLSYLVSTLLLVVMILIFRPRYEENRNEKQKLGKYVLTGAIVGYSFEWFAFIKILVIEVIYNVLLSVILYPLIRIAGFGIDRVFKKTNLLTRYF